MLKEHGEIDKAQNYVQFDMVFNRTNKAYTYMNLRVILNYIQVTTVKSLYFVSIKFHGGDIITWILSFMDIFMNTNSYSGT